MPAEIPRVGWDAVQRHLASSWELGQHVTALGPTGSGKTHACLELLRLRQYVLVLAAKPRDPLLSSLLGEGYEVVKSVRELEERGFSQDGVPLTPKVLFWPSFNPRRPLEEQTKLQARAMREALHFAYTTGCWTVLVDEAAWFSGDLGLEKDLRTLWIKGRSQDVSLVAAAQRPVHLPVYAYSQASHFLIWRTRDGRDLERLSEISSGVDRRLIERTVVHLDATRHEFLYFDSLTGVAGRVIAPARQMTRARQPAGMEVS